MDREFTRGPLATDSTYALMHALPRHGLPFQIQDQSALQGPGNHRGATHRSCSSIGTRSASNAAMRLDGEPKRVAFSDAKRVEPAQTPYRSIGRIQVLVQSIRERGTGADSTRPPNPGALSMPHR